MPKADFIHLPGFLRGFGLKDHTAAFTPVLESQVGKETAKDTTSQQEMISKRESDEKKRKEVRYLKKRGKKRSKEMPQYCCSQEQHSLSQTSESVLQATMLHFMCF